MDTKTQPEYWRCKIHNWVGNTEMGCPDCKSNRGEAPPTRPEKHWLEQPADIVEMVGDEAQCSKCGKWLQVSFENNGTNDPFNEEYYVLCNHVNLDE